MQVSAVTAYPGVGAAANQAGQLGRDDFLMLLVEQLRNQDPMKPMDDTQFIAQLAQFSTLEKMQQLDQRIALLLEVEQLGQASSLIGKEVEARTGGSGETVRGKVASVQVLGGIPVLMVEGKPIDLADVISVAEGESSGE